MPQVNLGVILQVIIALFGAFLLAFWISMIVWTFRDIRARSRDIFAQLLATLMVIVFNIPGLLIYFILRPPQTLAEVYDRALEEEALLKDIEERSTCPGCKRKVETDFMFCPDCHTRLKKACPACGRLLHLKWNVCPYCGATPGVPTFTPPQGQAPEVVEMDYALHDYTPEQDFDETQKVATAEQSEETMVIGEET
jgi:RNA polymerase subunit RPABC4/transcription elongation factor Spt4